MGYVVCWAVRVESVYIYKDFSMTLRETHTHTSHMNNVRSPLHGRNTGRNLKEFQMCNLILYFAYCLFL